MSLSEDADEARQVLRDRQKSNLGYDRLFAHLECHFDNLHSKLGWQFVEREWPACRKHLVPDLERDIGAGSLNCIGDAKRCQRVGVSRGLSCCRFVDLQGLTDVGRGIYHAWQQ